MGGGLIQNMETRGCQTTNGVGLRFTMDVGITVTTMAGAGFLDMNGDQLGFPGDKVVVSMVGRQWALE